MAHSIELVKDANYVRLSLVGELTRSDHESARAEASLALTENGWNKLLVDAIHAKPKMSALDHYNFTRDHKLHFPANLRTAIIHHPDATENFKFIENVGQNWGQVINLFTDQIQALDWLLDG